MAKTVSLLVEEVCFQMTKKEALLEEENEKLKKELEEYKACVRFIKDKMLSELYFAVSEQNIVEIDGVLLLFNGANVLKVSKEQYRLIRKILEENQ